MKIVIGIISGLPSDQKSRSSRGERLQRLLKQLKELGPKIPVYILAQNGDEDETTAATEWRVNERLGILKARKMLRRKLLELDADYFILFDDDAIISCQGDAHRELIELINEHPNGGAFNEHLTEGTYRHQYNPFPSSQLNLCCLSRYIYSREDMPNFDPEKSEAFEDRIYSMTILCKYPELQWHIPDTIYCTHFRNPNETAPSTWSKRKKYDWQRMRENTEIIEAGLIELYKHKKSQ